MADTTVTAAPVAPVATPATPTYADAVLIPSSYKSRSTGNRSFHRIKTILDIADPFLGVDRSKGDMSYFRSVEQRANDGTDNGSGSRYLLCTRGITDTLLHGNGHEKEKQPRYRWTPSSSDPLIQLGYLIDKS